MKLNDIRNIFLNFFEKNNHKVLPSSSLVPYNDPSLMFVNSGMVQFKNYFTGEQVSEFKRVTTSQKSVRAGGKHNDLDNVGYTARHHTFFEMLGNFSFGDYFKDDAIYFAWTLLTGDFSLPKEKLYVTVYHDDEEAIKIWKKVAGLSDDRIIRIKTTDNFWSMGDTGPCGPCSEIFYDHGSSIKGGLPGSPEEDGDRYIEIWNLVFMQYEQKLNGEREKLPKPCIDTGMGLERIAAVLQNVHNNYEIDLFKNIINATSDIAKIKITESNIASFRVIADHLRSSGFLIADGVMPSNEGRGYVLRRIMRRAMRHIHTIGCNDLLMYKLVDVLCNEMGDSYPELNRSKESIKSNFYNEENKFRATVTNGMKLLENAKSALKNNKFSGETAFKLYDTYGFPLDLTVDILRPEGIEVDIEEFDKEMAIQKENARKAWKGSGASKEDPRWYDIYHQHGATEFVGYNNNTCQAKILAKIEQDNSDLIITNQTPFYGESGGQAGDKGVIQTASGKILSVSDTKKFLGKIIAHETEKNDLKEGDSITLSINQQNREDTRKNHSATHLLHYSLRKILGNHVVQKGSYVCSDYLRFDFAHDKALSQEEFEKIEIDVNNQILANYNANVRIMDQKTAVESGAMALFGEKYDDEVRVVKFSESVELCGGTHVSATGEIGSFIITAETSIASGVRRIEAITGRKSVLHTQQQRNFKNHLSSILKSPDFEIISKVEKLLLEKKSLEKQLSDTKVKSLSNCDGEKIGEINFVSQIQDNVAPNDIRTLVTNLKKQKSTLVVMLSRFEEKTSLVIGVSDDLGIDAGKIIKDLCTEFGCSGGGKKDMAQAGGFSFEVAEKILNKVKTMCY